MCRRSCIVNSVYFYFTGIYYGRELGYDSFLDQNSNIIKIRGYFQTYKYFQSLPIKDNFFDLKVNKKSEWFTSFYSELLTKQIISVHVRRGDYLPEQTKIGLLSRAYYEEAIFFLQGLLPKSEIWVFSDDIFEARKLLDGVSSLKILWMEPPAYVDPAESLLLMSYSAGIVTANSSFSWWAAAIGNPNKHIVVPSPWFRKTKDPRFLSPDSWHRVKSNWQ